MSLTKLVREWIDKWEEGDFLNLPISDHFKHTSPYVIIEGKKEYINLVMANKSKFLGYHFNINVEIYDKEKACIRYTANQGDFKLEVSESYFLGEDHIDEIISYYNNDEERLDKY